MGAHVGARAHVHEGPLLDHRQARAGASQANHDSHGSQAGVRRRHVVDVHLHGVSGLARGDGDIIGHTPVGCDDGVAGVRR